MAGLVKNHSVLHFPIVGEITIAILIVCLNVHTVTEEIFISKNRHYHGAVEQRVNPNELSSIPTRGNYPL